MIDMYVCYSEVSIVSMYWIDHTYLSVAATAAAAYRKCVELDFARVKSVLASYKLQL
jgi:hypothetical protein